MFNSTSITLLEKSLDMASLRQQVLANNIANINTPGYKRSYVTFEESLKRALTNSSRLPLDRTNPDHLPVEQGNIVKAEVIREENTSLRHDGNNVDLDVEMARMAMNSINYNMSVAQIKQQLAMLKLAITGGRR